MTTGVCVSVDYEYLSGTKGKNVYEDFALQIEADIKRATSEKLRRMEPNYKPPIKTNKEASLAVVADYESRYSKYLPRETRERNALILSRLIKDMMNLSEEVIEQVKRSSPYCSSASATAMRSWFERLRIQWLRAPPCLDSEAAGIALSAFHLYTPIPTLSKDFIKGFLNFYKLPQSGPVFTGNPPISSMPFYIRLRFEKAVTTDIQAALEAGYMKHLSNAAEEVQEPQKKRNKKNKKKLNR